MCSQRESLTETQRLLNLNLFRGVSANNPFFPVLKALFHLIQPYPQFKGFIFQSTIRGNSILRSVSLLLSQMLHSDFQAPSACVMERWNWAFVSFTIILGSIISGPREDKDWTTMKEATLTATGCFSGSRYERLPFCS